MTRRDGVLVMVAVGFLLIVVSGLLWARFETSDLETNVVLIQNAGGAVLVDDLRTTPTWPFLAGLVIGAGLVGGGVAVHVAGLPTSRDGEHGEPRRPRFRQVDDA